MSSVVHRPGSFAAELQGQSTLQNIQWEVSQNNLNLVATREALQKHGVRIEEGLRDVSERVDSMDRTLVQGVITLHADLLAVEGSVRDLSAKFEWGIAQLEAGIGDVRDSLQDLVRLAKSPEQTWAYEQYDLARDAYRRGLFPEALEHVNRAISGYQGRTGHRLEHRFHRLLGMIHRTNSPDIMDLAKSKQAYLDAARYAGRDHAEDAAWALYAAARLSFDAGQIKEAEELLRRALTVDFKEGHYWLAKVLMHQHKVEPGLGELEKAIEADPLYSVKCFEHKEVEFLAHEQEVRGAIEGWRTALAHKCQGIDERTVDTARHVQTVANFCTDAVQACRDRLMVGGRFRLPAMPFTVADDISRIASMAQIRDVPYLVVRDYFNRRQERYELVARSCKPFLERIEHAQSALTVGTSEPSSWSMDGGAQFMTLLLALPLPVIAVATYYPSTQQEWLGSVILTVLFAIGMFVVGGPMLAELRAVRVNRLAEHLRRTLSKARESVEGRVREFGNLLSAVGSIALHAHWQPVIEQPKVTDGSHAIAPDNELALLKEPSAKAWRVAVKYGWLSLLIMVWSIYYFSPGQIAARQEKDRQGEILRQEQIRQQQKRQQEAEEAERQRRAALQREVERKQEAERQRQEAERRRQEAERQRQEQLRIQREELQQAEKKRRQEEFQDGLRTGRCGYNRWGTPECCPTGQVYGSFTGCRPPR